MLIGIHTSSSEAPALRHPPLQERKKERKKEGKWLFEECELLVNDLTALILLCEDGDGFSVHYCSHFFCSPPFTSSATALYAA